MRYRLNTQKIWLSLVFMVFILQIVSISSIAAGQQISPDISEPKGNSLAPIPTKKETKEDSISLSYIFIGIGVILLIGTLIYVYRSVKKDSSTHLE
ncbi:MAG: hypothetical protein QGH39_05360 [Candidatus Thermoplasmatota archaeon]|jgi:hypothetical protein|nr:hypothetical protein [Candidatus Thermoplasmatota archaeon]MDP7264973.1 hypothetical protein [Candidatus Thermoplasmatota archaeon]